MRTFLKSALAAAAITVAASSAQAALVLQYSQLGGVDTVQLVNNPGGYTLSTIGTPTVLATATDPTTAAFDFGRAAFSFTASGNGFASSQPNGPGSILTQGFTGGSVSFTALETFNIGAKTVNAGQVLLSFDFSGGFLTVPVPGNSGDAQVTIPGDSFSNVMSTYLDFPPFYLNAFSISITGTDFGQIAVPQNDDPIRIADFRADSTGTFDAAVPEPGTWAMMLAGFGLVGLTRRRANRVATVAA